MLINHCIIYSIGIQEGEERIQYPTQRLSFSNNASSYYSHACGREDGVDESFFFACCGSHMNYSYVTDKALSNI